MVYRSHAVHYADLAHLVERHRAKVEVAGSSPVIRSKKKDRFDGLFSIQSEGLAWTLTTG